ncbi:MAG: LytR C-terminal domain-containing protein, partial [candidate division NC10 bacterium]
RRPHPEIIPGARDLAVEVLNATQKIGIATQAKKVLRWKGADVVATGNAEAPQERTLIYDRLGRIENAEAVRRMLDCPSAETLTAVDSGRAVDVTVVLAEDCPLR